VCSKRLPCIFGITRLYFHRFERFLAHKIRTKFYVTDFAPVHHTWKGYHCTVKCRSCSFDWSCIASFKKVNADLIGSSCFATQEVKFQTRNIAEIVKMVHFSCWHALRLIFIALSIMFCRNSGDLAFTDCQTERTRRTCFLLATTVSITIHNILSSHRRHFSLLKKLAKFCAPRTVVIASYGCRKWLVVD